VISVGIRDVILPGDMKDLMNKVTEAKKAAEANLIARREETAAMRSQANTAKVLEGNPTLNRVNRFIKVRIVRLWRSTWLVHIPLSSLSRMPNMPIRSVPTISLGV
jgi:hypothetical protein